MNIDENTPVNKILGMYLQEQRLTAEATIAEVAYLTDIDPERLESIENGLTQIKPRELLCWFDGTTYDDRFPDPEIAVRDLVIIYLEHALCVMVAEKDKTKAVLSAEESLKHIDWLKAVYGHRMQDE